MVASESMLWKLDPASVRERAFYCRKSLEVPMACGLKKVVCWRMSARMAGRSKGERGRRGVSEKGWATVHRAMQTGDKLVPL